MEQKSEKHKNEPSSKTEEEVEPEFDEAEYKEYMEKSEHFASDIKSLEKDLNARETAVDQLEKDFDERQGEIDKLEASIKEMLKKVKH